MYYLQMKYNGTSLPDYVNSLQIKGRYTLFEENLHNKLNDSAFIEDIFPLLSPTQRINYDAKKEIMRANKKIIHNLVGEGWKGRKNAE
jgi:hypothetical protein